MSVDLSKVKIGDAVTVYGTVREVFSDTLRIRVQIGRYSDNLFACVAGWVTDCQKADALKRADEIVALLKAGEP